MFVTVPVIVGLCVYICVHRAAERTSAEPSRELLTVQSAVRCLVAPAEPHPLLLTAGEEHPVNGLCSPVNRNNLFEAVMVYAVTLVVELRMVK